MHENRSATHDGKEEDSAPASRPGSPPENRTADNYVKESALRPQDCRAFETHTSTLHSCSTLGKYPRRKPPRSELPNTRRQPVARSLPPFALVHSAAPQSCSPP